MYQKVNLDAYALAIFEIAQEQNVVDQTRQLLIALYHSVKNDNELINSLRDPEITKQEKYNYLKQIFADFPQNELVINFLMVIIEHGAISNLRWILSTYLKMTNEMLNVRYAKIFTAFPLSKEVLNKFKVRLENDYHCKVDIVNIIDPNIISGFKIKMDSVVIEHSLGKQLQQLSKTIKSEGDLNG
ncbi:ATP synthase F1 subunit delta [Mycoplasmopsis columbinasalis]|uniref:ATP synthase subunit delta n=1 Tax=Mycoplasmopsis columbinasalis TaxID=114880 RepID=A0A449B9Z2_9BACT|nr:ATP synthase F1 subunit delta [Mycoplasmopsis columbinasalis]VEU77975.1 ATP synthase delta chain [Mycoplasmopsis columbinasalis]